MSKNKNVKKIIKKFRLYRLSEGSQIIKYLTENTVCLRCFYHR